MSRKPLLQFLPGKLTDKGLDLSRKLPHKTDQDDEDTACCAHGGCPAGLFGGIGGSLSPWRTLKARRDFRNGSSTTVLTGCYTGPLTPSRFSVIADMPVSRPSANSRREQVQQQGAWKVDYSITPSAVVSSCGGTVRSSIVAVCVLMNSSNLLACTGRSAGLAPLTMRPT